MPMIKISVAAVRDPEKCTERCDVDAAVFGNWAVHASRDVDGYVVTHVPSGRRIPHIGELDLQEALDVAAALADDVPELDLEELAAPGVGREWGYIIQAAAGKAIASCRA